MRNRTAPENDEEIIELQKMDPKSAEILTAIRTYDPTLKFNLDKYLIDLMQQNAFFATVSRYVRKLECWEVDTAAMAWDSTNEEFTLLYNPAWMAYNLSCPNGEKVVNYVLIHEFYHLILEHVTTRIQLMMKFWNVATDCAINCLIEMGNSGSKHYFGALRPGEAPEFLSGNLYPKGSIQPGSVMDVVQKFPKDKSSDWYYYSLLNEAEKNGWDTSDQDGEGGITFEFTDGEGNKHQVNMKSPHKGWGQMSEDEKEFINEKLKQLMERAVKVADQTASNGWGNIPSELRCKIRQYVSRQVDWKQLLRQFVGRSLRGERRHSMKRVNKKYPYIHPGTKRGYIAKGLICMDQSGSVGDSDVELFFAELANLTRKTTITVLPFDHTIDEKNMFDWKKGQKIANLARTRSGGTDFEAPTKFVNDDKNRGRFDFVIFLTDGECAKPSDSRVKRAWIICPNRKLLFETSETVITMSRDEIVKDNAPIY